MSDDNSMPPKEPKISEAIRGYVYLQVMLFVAIVYGMKNLDPWPFGVGRCDIIHYLYIAGFLITTLLILINYTEGKAENLVQREKIGATRTLIGRAIFIPLFFIGWYFVLTRGQIDFCEKFFSGSDGFKSVIEAKNFIFSFMAVCSSPALVFFFLF